MVRFPRYIVIYREELIEMVQSKELILHGATYIIFSDGKVIGPSRKVLKQRKDKDGYLYFLCCGGKKHFFTHRAVALCFVHNPDPATKVEVDHKDNDRANPSADNLQWVTHAENIKKAAENGSYSGERNSHAILNRYEAIFAKEACKQGIARKILSQMFGISEYAIYELAKGKTWKMLA